MDNTTKRWAFDIVAWTLGLAAGLLLMAHDALAGGRLSTPADDRWKAECGSCHIAYPPQLLPAQAWRSMMSQLDRHFGADASLAAADRAHIAAFLERNAGSGRRVRGAAESLRITESAWVLHEHDEVAPASWNHPAVKSPANCAACHTSAEQGDFRKRNLRIPR
jgi:nitrate/TMAO reductase-like tetraheme cytochrome c subunit